MLLSRRDRADLCATTEHANANAQPDEHTHSHRIGDSHTDVDSDRNWDGYTYFNREHHSEQFADAYIHSNIHPYIYTDLTHFHFYAVLHPHCKRHADGDINSLSNDYPNADNNAVPDSMRYCNYSHLRAGEAPAPSATLSAWDEEFRKIGRAQGVRPAHVLFFGYLTKRPWEELPE